MQLSKSLCVGVAALTNLARESRLDGVCGGWLCVSGNLHERTRTSFNSLKIMKYPLFQQQTIIAVMGIIFSTHNYMHKLLMGGGLTT